MQALLVQLAMKFEVCIRSEKKGKSTCVVSTTRYFTMYIKVRVTCTFLHIDRLKFEYGVWHVLPRMHRCHGGHGRPGME
ncbi:hypothetical protein IFM89_024829 [Coptis chinensis]|uniref:Uncharacterized protein n=1 Tax=Coptis chinensis TaxID=261450 RepID=A0A835LRD7_9MAGN|nr:hypothetical protein IFM89_024829 [Coptis chinensis]